MEKILCPSMMCADFSALGREVDELNNADSDMLHIDIMDGVFVPNFGMGLQDTEFIIKRSKKPVDVHLMINNPGNYVAKFAEMGAAVIYIHTESDLHCPRTLQNMINLGVKPGIALNPGTAAVTVEPLLTLAEYVLIMTVNPGFAGQRYLDFVDDKIDDFLRMRDRYDFKIIIDGACSPKRIADLNKKGVEGFVLGTSALFNKGKSYREVISGLRGE